MKILFVIPARGGSKRLPNKNIKLLNGKPLICYSIDSAREITEDVNICVSTDSEKIRNVVESYGLTVPFLRPAQLATDSATTNDVIAHTLDYYKSNGVAYDVVILLQPTSPVRTKQYIEEAISMFNEKIDMIVSVKKSHAAAVLCGENELGYLDLIINKNSERSQNIRDYYEYNGSIYLVNVKEFLKKGLQNLTKRKKIVMSDYYSVDIDTALDFELAEFLINKRNEK